jgi:hypothetical protein
MKNKFLLAFLLITLILHHIKTDDDDEKSTFSNDDESEYRKNPFNSPLDVLMDYDYEIYSSKNNKKT